MPIRNAQDAQLWAQLAAGAAAKPTPNVHPVNATDEAISAADRMLEALQKRLPPQQPEQ